MHFLVIDDDELSRELLSILLGAEGHKVDTVASGEEALAWLAGNAVQPPQVVLSDMQMPGISGKALAAALRISTGIQTRLLAMSASQPDQALLEDFDGFLLKPFSSDELHGVLARTEGFSGLSDPSGPADADFGTDVPILDEEIYVKMAKMMPKSQLGEMYAMCLADARKRLVEMERLASIGDNDGYSRAAHTVKGGCGMLGASQLYHLAETAERDGLAGEMRADSLPADGTSRVTTLLRRFSRACDRLERILGERK